MENCETLAEEVRQKTGCKALAHSCHVGDWDSLEGLVDAAYSEFGKVDTLVNNAGMSPLYDKIEDVSEGLWDKVIDVNLKGPFRLTQLIGPRMAAGDGGSIINVSSIASHYPTPDVIPYAAAKAGLNAMTKGYARMFGPSVRVNCIVCGSFRTDISKAWDMPKVEKHAKEVYALQRVGEPEEIIGAALYLASDASTYTSGALLDVDGGR